MSKRDPLAYLLDLHGEILVQEGGYWIKIEARRCEPSAQIPHGISYSLTLHDGFGKRVLGFDSAHADPSPGTSLPPGAWNSITGIPMAARSRPTNLPMPASCSKTSSQPLTGF